MNHGIGYQFKIINDRIKQRADADLQAHDLTLTQTRVLGFIMEAGGQVAQKDIERDLQVSHPTVVGVVSRMEQKGFLTSWVDPMDRRNKLIRVTPKAIETDRQINATVQKQDEKLLRGLTPQQIEVLCACLDHIAKNLEND